MRQHDNTVGYVQKQQKIHFYWLCGIMWKHILKAWNYKMRKILKNIWACMRYFCSRLFTSYHRIRIGWIYALSEIQIIPCQIHGYVYFVHPFQNSPFKLMDIVRAHDMQRICYSPLWLLQDCFCLSFASLWGRLGEASHVFVCQTPIYNRSISQNKSRPSKCSS